MKTEEINKNNNLQNKNKNQTTEQKILNIKQVFLKRLDFKALVNPLDHQQNSHSESSVNIHIHHQKKEDNQYLVFLTIELNGFDDEKRTHKIFNLTTEVFGLFEIANFDPSERNLLFYGFCANTLFPYIRSQISATLNQSGFKPILLSPINFEHLYLTKLKEKQLEEMNKQKANQTSQPNQKINQPTDNQENQDNKNKITKKSSNLKVH